MRFFEMAIRYAVTKLRNETPDVTKLDVRLSLRGEDEPTAVLGKVDLARSCRLGRPPAGAVAMSGAERVRKYRDRRRGAVAAS
jgi:hypothetical protein